MEKRVLTLIYLLSFPFLSWPADLLQTLCTAKQHDPTYQSQRMSFAAKSLNYPIKQASILPSIKLSAEGTSSSQTSSAALAFPLLNPTGVIQSQINRAGHGANNISRNQFEVKYVLDITKNYFDVLIKKSKEDAITLEYQENQKNYEETIAMREAGLKTEVDILSAKASLDLAEVSLLKAQNDKQHAASTLKTKINSDLKHLQGISINTKLDLPPINAEIVYQNAMRDNSSILLAQNRLQTSRYEVDKSYAAFLPKVDLSVSVSQDLNDDLFEWDNKSVNASIKASVGLYNGQADVNTHKQKSLEYVSSQANLDNAYYDLSIQLDKSFSDYENAKAQIKATYSAIQSSQAQMAAIQEKSHSGLATELEVLSAISQVSKAQQKFFEASYQMVTTYLELHALTGHISYDTLQAINSLLTIDISVD